MQMSSHNTLRHKRLITYKNTSVNKRNVISTDQPTNNTVQKEKEDFQASTNHAVILITLEWNEDIWRLGKLYPLGDKNQSQIPSVIFVLLKKMNKSDESFLDAFLHKEYH